MPEMTAYEQAAQRDTDKWKRPEPTHAVFDLFNKVTRPMDLATGWLAASPLGAMADKALTGVLGALHQGTVQTVDPEGVYAKFRAKGHPGVKDADDIFALDLESVEKVAGALNVPYVAAGLAEGTATGFGGAAGLAADIPLVLALNLRAIADYAAHYGRDPRSEAERVYALIVLDYALSPTSETKRNALTKLAALEKAIDGNKTLDELRSIGGTQGIKTLTDSIAHRMAKAKAAQMLPIAGAVVGGGFNAWLTKQTCDAAYHLYRGRFLAKRFA